MLVSHSDTHSEKIYKRHLNKNKISLIYMNQHWSTQSGMLALSFVHIFFRLVQPKS